MKQKLFVMRKLIRYALFSSILVVSSLISIYKVAADSPSLWITDQDPTWTIEQNNIDANAYNQQGSCDSRQITYSTGPDWFGNYTDHTATDCFVDTPYGQLSGSWYIPPGNLKAGKYTGPQPILLSGEKDLYATGNAQYSGVYLFKYLDAGIKMRKHPESLNGYKDTYYLDPNIGPDLSLKDNANNLVAISSNVNISSNRNWLVATTQNGTFVRINLKTFNILPFGNSGFTSANSYLTISDDGRYVYSYSYAWGSFKNQLFDLSSCNDNPTNNLSIVSGCGSKDIGSYLSTHGSHGGSSARFSSDNTQLSMVTSLNNDPNPKLITLTAAGQTTANNQFDYLALGDSFSSGEGEISDSHYLSGTNVEGNATMPTEKCHVSDRSYPFILAHVMGISNDKFKNIACSGATIDDITNTSDQYHGQDGRLPKPIDNNRTQLDAFQNEARQNFIPGRVSQIEFVKKYKPKILTISIGGNDLGFKNIINSCVSSDCSHASDDTQKRQDGINIESIFGKLVSLYNQLHSASPTTKIYVIGYPKFIKEHTACAVNVQLNDNEREFINQATEYLDSVIEKAAQKVGVAYINILDSLSGHELCSGALDQIAVNGITPGDDQPAWEGTPILDQKMIGNESFHPAPAGQRLMANAILSVTNNNLLTYDNCPDIDENTEVYVCPYSSASAPDLPAYFDTAPTHPLEPQSLVKLLGDGAKIAAKGAASPLNAFGEMFAPGSNVHIEIHSTPIDLGDYTVNNNGQVSAQITLPSTVPTGYHTIHMIGTSISGQQIDLYQPLTVVGPDSNDVDEDGIANANDPCPFINPSGVDQDQDGIDDACDGYIEPIATGDLYRARNGIAANGEDPNQLYLERNTTAATKELGYFDYDPDNDGWAIVAHSNDVTTNGSFVKMLMQDAKPYLLFNHPVDGCKALTVSSLEEVKQSDSRVLELTAMPSGASCEQ